MSEVETVDVGLAVNGRSDDEAPDHPSGAAPRAPSVDGTSTLLKVARIRCLDQVKARGFTFAKGKVVEGVPLAHAEYLAAGGKAEVLEVC